MIEVSQPPKQYATAEPSNPKPVLTIELFTFSPPRKIKEDRNYTNIVFYLHYTYNIV